MSWEQRKDQAYYYRRRRVDGRVVAEYLGRGPHAELAATLDQLERAVAVADAERLRLARERDQLLDQMLGEHLDQLQGATSILLANEGLHQPKGTWRRKR
ncbi:UNVERIFIED_CONTAM: hypothetical protein BEN50_21270 [Euhalothece sp. KZN 001]